MLNTVPVQQEQSTACVMSKQEQGKCLWKLAFFGLNFFFFLNLCVLNQTKLGSSQSFAVPCAAGCDSAILI